MIRATVWFILLIPFNLAAQVKLTKLVIKPHEVYALKNSDILVVDTLVMMDSSVLLLNKLKRENFIHARRIIFYPGSLIDGKGVHGLNGRNGKTGSSSTAPCSNAAAGLKGTDGTNGGTGITLFLSFNDVVLHGVAAIDVSGGDAGDGGKGGPGGGGGTGTRLCAGGNGGAGGPGSNGGNGGMAGMITFHANDVAAIRSMLGERILVHNFGGNAGNGGDGGGGGYAGLSPTGKNSLDGKPGKTGIHGKDGISGKPGTINFQSK